MNMKQEILERGFCKKDDKESLRKKIKEACDRLADTLTDEVYPKMLNGTSGNKHFVIRVFKPEEGNENEIPIKFIHTF